jgi:hypothetical protein
MFQQPISNTDFVREHGIGGGENAQQEEIIQWHCVD